MYDILGTTSELFVWTKMTNFLLYFEIIICLSTPHPLGADEVSRESWQLVTSLHDEGDGLTPLKYYCGVLFDVIDVFPCEVHVAVHS